MQESAVKKSAEVAAFIALAKTIAERAGQSFAEHAPGCRSRLDTIAAVSFNQAIPAEHQALFTSKTDRTISKLTTMMELYVGDEWDNPVEVLEWCSFYSGAGAAHCAISAHLMSSGSSNPDDLSEFVEQLDSLESVFRSALDETINRLAS